MGLSKYNYISTSSGLEVIIGIVTLIITLVVTKSHDPLSRV